MYDLKENAAVLALEDGSLFYGRSSGQKKTICGEIVFNTSMTGYQEVCTDPSYSDQIVLFTASHLGNVGTNKDDYESMRVWIKGLIAREITKNCNHWRSEKGFSTFLNENSVPWMEGLDTRKLTRHIRDNGNKIACMMVGDIDTDLAIKLAQSHISLPGRKVSHGIIDPISTKRNKTVLFSNDNIPHICIYDFGVKSNTLNILTRLGCSFILIPSHKPIEEILLQQPDGIILSSGPGDPASMIEEIGKVRQLLTVNIPILGLCLGCQLIALAAGGKTKKMKFGHHGVNHPVYDVNAKSVHITSQNHNFVIDETALPLDYEVSHISLFDYSIQGIKSKNKSIIGFQGHPEGSPGPQDIYSLFERFIDEIKKCR